MRRTLFRNVIFSVVLVALALTTLGSSLSVAEDPPYAPNEGPVYFLVNFLEGDPAAPFDLSMQNETIVVNIGSFVGGDTVGDTRYVINSALELSGITLPDGRKDPTFEDLQNHHATVFGSFYTLDEQGFHTAVPTAGGEVPVEVQEAIFWASNSGAIDALVAKKGFPTTTEVIRTIKGFIPEGYVPPSGESAEELIFNHIYGHAFKLVPIEEQGVQLAEGEGEIFPYEPYSESLYVFRFTFNESEEFTQEVRLEIPIDFQGPINVSSKQGELAAVIGDTEVYKAVDVIGSSLLIPLLDEDGDPVLDDDGDPIVFPVGQYQLTGNGQMVAKWNVAELVEGGVLSLSTTELTVFGKLYDGTLIVGTAPVTVK